MFQVRFDNDDCVMTLAIRGSLVVRELMAAVQTSRNKDVQLQIWDLSEAVLDLDDEIYIAALTNTFRSAPNPNVVRAFVTPNARHQQRLQRLLDIIQPPWPSHIFDTVEEAFCLVNPPQLRSSSNSR